MRPYRTDWLLWGVLTAVVASTLGLAEYRHDPDRGAVAGGLWWVRDGFTDFWEVAPNIAPFTLGLLAVAAAAAWSAHTLLVLCGVRLPAVCLFRTPDQAADYDDAPAPPAP
jgi:hypothetical protein